MESGVSKHGDVLLIVFPENLMMIWGPIFWKLFWMIYHIKGRRARRNARVLTIFAMVIVSIEHDRSMVISFIGLRLKLQDTDRIAVGKEGKPRLKTRGFRYHLFFLDRPMRGGEVRNLCNF